MSGLLNRTFTANCMHVRLTEDGPCQRAAPQSTAQHPTLHTDSPTQQAEVLRAHTDLRVGVLCGEMAVDWWDAGRWAQELAGHDLLVSTPQVRPP